MKGLSQIANNTEDELDTPSENATIIKELYKQCSYKRSGYVQQDRHKKMDGSLVLSVQDIASKLIDSNLQCHYCCETSTVFYENVRDPEQWTLDRLDNSIGHIKDNVVICCLSCNLRRKTMNEERYLFTKQFKYKETSIENNFMSNTINEYSIPCIVKDAIPLREHENIYNKLGLFIQQNKVPHIIFSRGKWMWEKNNIIFLFI